MAAFGTARPVLRFRGAGWPRISCSSAGGLRP